MSETRYYKTDHPGWEMDSETGAIINRDDNAYNRWRLQRKEANKKKQLENEVTNLKKDVADIKSMLETIYRKING